MREDEMAGDQVNSAGLLVVGVGRSGTSIACKLTTLFGLRPPNPDDLMTGDAYNPDGYWESKKLAMLNDALLAVWGSSWWKPPRHLTRAMLAHLKSKREIAADSFQSVFGSEPGWVWKDPRLTVLLPLWDGVLGEHPVLFAVRNPHDVARSISKRDGLTHAQALAIWERHTRLALSALGGKRVALMSYEHLLSSPGDWIRELFAFCEQASLPVSFPRDLPSLNSTVRGPDSEALTAGQTSLVQVLAELNGVHDSFPKLDIDEESVGTDELIESVALPDYGNYCENYQRLLTERAELMADHERISAERTRIANEHRTLREEVNRLAEENAEYKRRLKSAEADSRTP